MKTFSIKKGDIIIKSFKNNNGKWVRRHPLIVVATKGKRIAVISDRAIFAAFAMSGETTWKSTLIKDTLEDWGIFKLNEKDGVKKPSILQVDEIILFSKDVLPVDKQGEVNPNIVDEAIKVFQELEEQGLAKINIHNLPILKNEEEIMQNVSYKKDEINFKSNFEELKSQAKKNAPKSINKKTTLK